jgi:hypothetical protein
MIHELHHDTFSSTYTVSPQSPTVRTKSIIDSSSHLTMTPVPYQGTEVKENLGDGIGGDWAIELDEDAATMEEPVGLMDDDLSPEPAPRRESSLYSFYFETPLLPMVSEKDLPTTDDFTITSHDTESFHDNDLNLTILQDSASFWETGLSAPCPGASEEEDRCTSPAHVSVSGDDRGRIQMTLS